MTTLRCRIHVLDHAVENPCGICGQVIHLPQGLQLTTGDRPAPVCRKCGRAHAPLLSALLELAQLADKVGRVQVHTRAELPMLMLLELAHASAKFFTASGWDCKIG